MKRLLLRLSIALFTFSTGVGLDRLLGSKPRPVEKAPPIVSYEPMDFVPTSLPVLPAVPIAVSSPTPRIICDYDPNKFYPVVDLYLIGKKPRFFEDGPVNLLILSTEIESQVTISISSFGWLEAPPINFALITDRRLFFVTDKTDGFEYRFDGKFLRHRDLYDAPEGKAVLRGTLTKSKNGRTVGEWPLEFAVVHDGC